MTRTFGKLEDILTKTAKECLGSSRRWTRNKKTRSRGEAENKLCSTVEKYEQEWARSWDTPPAKRRKTGAHQESRAGEGHDEPRLRERVRQRHLREKDAEKGREKAAREDRGKVGRKEGLNNLYKMLRSHFKGGRNEPQHVVKDSKGHILTDRAEVLNRYDGKDERGG